MKKEMQKAKPLVICESPCYLVATTTEGGRPIKKPPAQTGGKNKKNNIIRLFR